MAYNYLGLVNDINRRLNEVELTSSNFASAVGYYALAKDAVNSSIRYINQEQFEWPFNHDTVEEPLDIGVVRYLTPYDTKTVDWDTFRIKRGDTNETRKLQLISYEEYLDKYVDYEYNSNNSIQGLPRYIVRTPSQEYAVVPPPDKEYEIVYEYYRLPVDLQNATDVPSVPEQFRHVVVDGSMYYTYQFRGDTENAAISLQKFNEGIDNMRTLYINRYEYVRSTVIERMRRGNLYAY